jgi:hypothetical protein
VPRCQDQTVATVGEGRRDEGATGGGQRVRSEDGAAPSERKATPSGGRGEGRAIRRYLEALEADRRRGRPQSAESLQRRLQIVTARIESADPLSRVHLIQERINVEDALRRAQQSTQLAALEEGFVAAAASYSRRRGITWDAWRAAGVSLAVLRRAGIPRHR